MSTLAYFFFFLGCLVALASVVGSTYNQLKLWQVKGSDHQSCETRLVYWKQSAKFFGLMVGGILLGGVGVFVGQRWGGW